jgi:hypothetical protein
MMIGEGAPMRAAVWSAARAENAESFDPKMTSEGIRMERSFFNWGNVTPTIGC